MSWKLWVFTVVMVCECFISIFRIGKVKEPYTSEQAAYQVLEMAFLMWLVLS